MSAKWVSLQNVRELKDTDLRHKRTADGGADGVNDEGEAVRGRPKGCRLQAGEEAREDQAAGRVGELTRYTRRHARRLMSQQGKKLWLNQKTKIVGDVKKRMPRERVRVYDERVVTVLIKLWKMLDYICGKRLVILERARLLQEQGPTVITSQPIIDRGFEEAPGIFYLAAGNSALSRLPHNRILRQAQISRDFL